MQRGFSPRHFLTRQDRNIDFSQFLFGERRMARHQNQLLALLG
jgi:hypothetical protein